MSSPAVSNLADFYFGDPRVVLVPIEHLTPEGPTTVFTEALNERALGGTAAMLADAFPLYWQRANELSRSARPWPAPRIRNIAVIDSTTAIPPYVQLLNTSTWTLFDCDFDPASSSVEFLAYLLAHGDRMSATGEATMAAVANAPYWYERSDQETADFQAGARASIRPDADAFAALADAIPWLREIAHESLRPGNPAAGYRPIANTGLSVPRSIERKPPELVALWTKTAKQSIADYYRHYTTKDSTALAEILDWLREEKPELLVVAGSKNRAIWDPVHAERIGPLRNQLRNAGGETQRSILADWKVIAGHTRAFRASTDLFDELPTPGEEIGQDGYAYLYRGRKILAYNLNEPNLERLKAPSLPYARAMLGARAAHEWCHLAVDAGWVRRDTPDESFNEQVRELADAFSEAIARAPSKLREATRGDLDDLQRTHPASSDIDLASESLRIEGDGDGFSLVRMLLPRVADFQANLLAAKFQRTSEREAYVRQNIRTLRGEYTPTGAWRMFARYVYELQYLRFSEVGDPHRYFFRSTFFERDFIDAGLVGADSFERTDRAFAALLNSFSIVHTKITPRVPSEPE